MRKISPGSGTQRGVYEAKSYAARCSFAGGATALEAIGGLLKARPDLASSREVRAVGDAIERRMSAGSCGAILLEMLSLIRGAGQDASGAPPALGK